MNVILSNEQAHSCSLASASRPSEARRTFHLPQVCRLHCHITTAWRAMASPAFTGWVSRAPVHDALALLYAHMTDGECMAGLDSGRRACIAQPIWPWLCCYIGPGIMQL